MTIDDKTIDKLARLSSLYIDDKDKKALAVEIEEIVQFVNNLDDIDVSHVRSTFTTIKGGLTLRRDEVVSNPDFGAKLLANAPKSDDGYFIVPNIL
ncbi:MAG: Asp-tRNA(Asn)/Glu-tRNA(Gln) amidotransferase GatCAB subunit C [Epsilonproteobacteria bacterium]|nr:MAG: Asp-tRNA(Asn)/Glu-tRNA(Gln) amidotransferase GatCAB subunit C [Campylobacterota bacterium]